MSKYSEASKAYSILYAATKLKRIPLNVRLEEYDVIKAAADARGESVNGFIKKAIWARIESEKAETEKGQGD